jgi:hypothetical protein
MALLSLGPGSFDADTYWRMFLLARGRLQAIKEVADRSPRFDEFAAEAFLLRVRMLLEQFALMVRAGGVLSDSMSRRSRTSYSPKDVLRGLEEHIGLFRFKTLSALREIRLDPVEVELQVEYGEERMVDPLELLGLYGRLNNFLHVSLRPVDPVAMENLYLEAFAYCRWLRPILHRHLFFVGEFNGPRSKGVLLGQADDLKDIFWEFHGDAVVKRSG